jgi:hypothetical protein
VTDRKADAPRDPVVAYDVMRFAANRLAAIYASRATIGGIEDPAILAIAELYAEVEAVDSHDMAAQDAATASFRARRSELEAETSS